MGGADREDACAGVDGHKVDLVAWANFNRETLHRLRLVSTATTGRLVKDKVGLEVDGVPSAPHGGDVQRAQQFHWPPPPAHRGVVGERPRRGRLGSQGDRVRYGPPINGRRRGIGARDGGQDPEGHGDAMRRPEMAPAQRPHLNPKAMVRMFQSMEVVEGASFLRIAGGYTWLQCPSADP